jgi:hypothetical protein
MASSVPTDHATIARMTRLGSIALFALIALTAVGCGGALAPSQRYGGTVPLTLVNDVAGGVCYVRMSPTFDAEWGEDWLGATEVIPQGGERTFTIAPQSQWDIRVENCDEEPIAERRSIDVRQPTRLAVSTLMPTTSIFTPPPPPPPPPTAACDLTGHWAGTGTDQQGTQWVWTMSFAQQGANLEGAINWRGSDGHGGLERFRGTIDCATHAFTISGYAIENNNGLIPGTYRGVVGGDWRSIQGSWADGVPGSFIGQRQ